MKPIRQFTVRYLTPDGRRGTWLPHSGDIFRTPREAMDFAAKELGPDYRVKSAFEGEFARRKRLRRELSIPNLKQ